MTRRDPRAGARSGGRRSARVAVVAVTGVVGVGLVVAFAFGAPLVSFLLAGLLLLFPLLLWMPYRVQRPPHDAYVRGARR